MMNSRDNYDDGPLTSLRDSSGLVFEDVEDVKQFRIFSEAHVFRALTLTSCQIAA